MLIDSHCHLDYYTPLELPDVLARAEAAGVGQMVTIGTTLDQSAALPGLIAGFERLSAAHRGVVAAEVTSAVKLSAAQTKALKAVLAKSLGKDPEITARVDPLILGGLKVKVGSRLFDASLRSKLDSLKFALKRA